MTVQELIEELSKIPQGKQIYICGSDSFYIYNFDTHVLIDHTELDDEEDDEED